MVDYASVEYEIEGLEAFEGPGIIGLKSQYFFELKLSALLAKALGMSVGQIKKLAESGAISTSPAVDIMKYRIKGDLDIILQF